MAASSEVILEMQPFFVKINMDEMETMK